VSELSLQKTFLVGNSMGGWIAMKFVASHPEFADGLALEDSAGVTDPAADSLLDEINDSGVRLLIVWGSNDNVLPVSSAKYLHSKIKRSTLTVFDNTGHVPHWEKPEEFNQLLSEFIRKTRGMQNR